MSEEPSALEARGLTKRYRDVVALSDCSFQLPANQIIALVGANGAGKSTLMSIAAGLRPATSGEVLAGGQRVDPHRRPRPADTAHRVAILAQDKPLYRDFTVADMLKFGQHTNRVWDQRRAVNWLDRFEVPLQRRCGRLSGGQRAQVAFAVALGGCPDVLLLDEPLANLDPVARSEVTGELIAEVADSGMTVILSTHIVAELAGVGEYLLLLAGGRPVLAGLLDLTARINRDFAFRSGVTTIATPVARVLRLRAGVCQDFSHVMIAGLRALGLPARYVSGYIRTRPPPGRRLWWGSASWPT